MPPKVKPSPRRAAPKATPKATAPKRGRGRPSKAVGKNPFIDDAASDDEGDAEISEAETVSSARNMSVEIDSDEPDFAVVITPPRKGRNSVPITPKTPRMSSRSASRSRKRELSDSEEEVLINSPCKRAAARSRSKSEVRFEESLNTKKALVFKKPTDADSDEEDAVEVVKSTPKLKGALKVKASVITKESEDEDVVEVARASAKSKAAAKVKAVATGTSPVDTVDDVFRVPALKSKVAKMKITAQPEVEEEPYSGWSDEDDEKKSPSPKKGKGISTSLKVVAKQINKKESESEEEKMVYLEDSHATRKHSALSPAIDESDDGDRDENLPYDNLPPLKACMHRPWAVQTVGEDGQIRADHRLACYSDIQWECPDANM
ncbi:hypothetical protein FIBSPDRAFT_891905, partial [Athelia psychrophila]